MLYPIRYIILFFFNALEPRQQPDLDLQEVKVKIRMLQLKMLSKKDNTQVKLNMYSMTTYLNILQTTNNKKRFAKFSIRNRIECGLFQPIVAKRKECRFKFKFTQFKTRSNINCIIYLFLCVFVCFTLLFLDKIER
jgi:hypothetical protein